MAKGNKRRGGAGTKRAAKSKRKHSSVAKSKKKTKKETKTSCSGGGSSSYAERIKMLEKCAYDQLKHSQHTKIEHDPAEKARRTLILAKRVNVEYPVQAINNNREKYLHSICYPVHGPKVARGLNDDVRFAARSLTDIC